MKKIIAVIPVWGRTPVLKYTIKRLLEKNGCHAVVCVGDLPEDKKCVEENGGVWVYHSNDYLGAKWNAAFARAREFNPNGILFMGSTDWVSDNWSDMYQLLDQYDLIGKPDFYMIDINPDTNVNRACWWPGYSCHRKGEPIGIGRIVSARVLDKFDWKPFVDKTVKSMDYQLYNKAKEWGKCCTVHLPAYKSLSFSTSRWPNLHKFEDHWAGKIKSDHIDVERIMKEFPEIKLISWPAPKPLKQHLHKRNYGRR